MRIAYVTSSLPRGPREAFVIPELLRLLELGHSVTIIPTRPMGPVVHGECAELVRYAECHGLFSPRVSAAALAETVTRPREVIRAIAILRGSRSMPILVKNLSVIPKALWLARLVRRSGIDHIHAAWMSTPATVALIASQLSGIPWSASAHRWDIEEGNLLREKVRSAEFTRAISRRGVTAIVGECGHREKVVLIRVGIRIPGFPHQVPRCGSRVVVAGNLIPLKGHLYLLEAVARLRRTGVDVTLDVVGDGRSRACLEAYVANCGIAEAVTFHGQLPHDRLLEDLEKGHWTLVVVPSVVEGDGATEGVPVIILEAMARGVAVVATDVGAIGEVGEGGIALLVPERDSAALADAIRTLLADPAVREEMIAKAYHRVRQEFDTVTVTNSLVARFVGAGAVDMPTHSVSELTASSAS